VTITRIRRNAGACGFLCAPRRIKFHVDIRPSPKYLPPVNSVILTNK
jgi:hypothetical protein